MLHSSSPLCLCQANSQVMDGKRIVTFAMGFKVIYYLADIKKFGKVRNQVRQYVIALQYQYI
jgi:hypothetical protein